MTISIHKKVTVAIGLIVSVQNAWAACEAEVARAVRESSDPRMRDDLRMMELGVTLKDKDFFIEQVRNLTLRIDAELKVPSKNTDSLGYMLAKRCMFQSGLARVGVGSDIQKPAQGQPQQQGTQLPILQYQTQESQQLTQASQQSARQNQSRADQQRQGKRKTHDPAAEASNCLEPDALHWRIRSNGAMVQYLGDKPLGDAVKAIAPPIQAKLNDIKALPVIDLENAIGQVSQYWVWAKLTIKVINALLPMC